MLPKITKNNIKSKLNVASRLK